jgi:hypothetical protein
VATEAANGFRHGFDVRFGARGAHDVGAGFGKGDGNAAAARTGESG